MNKSSSIAVFLFCVVCLPITTPLPAAKNQKIYSEDNRYESILKLIYEYDLAAAERAVDSLIAENPDNPKPYFFMTLVRWWCFVGDVNSRSFKESFLKSAERAVEVGRTQVDAHESDVGVRFYLGAAYGYLARYYVFTGEWLDAYYYGKKAKDIFSGIIKEDNTNYDAHLAVGIYDYYADELPALLKIFAAIIGLGGDKRLGMHQLRLAADSGNYSRVEALSMLGQVDLEFENNFAGAVRSFFKLSDEYKSNPVFRTLLAKSYRKSGEYDKAILTCRELLNDRSIKYVSANQLAGLNAELAYCYMLVKDYALAISAYRACESLAGDNFLNESPWIYYNIGLCEESERNYPDAVAYYRKVLECNNYFDYRSLARKSIVRIRNAQDVGN